MKKLKLIRLSNSEECTQGVLKDTETGICLMLTFELPWLNNEPCVSCIPSGTYTVTKYSSTKYPDAYEITNVPNRTHILIHTGNTVDHTRGCILPGSTFGVLGNKRAVLASGSAYKKLKSFVKDEDWELEVVDVN